jgi:hypothetical protein
MKKKPLLPCSISFLRRIPVLFKFIGTSSSTP